MDESDWYPPGQEGVLDAAGWHAHDRRWCATRRRLVEGEYGLKAQLPSRMSGRRWSSRRRSTGCSTRPTSTSASTPATTPSGTRIRWPTWSGSAAGSPTCTSRTWTRRCGRACSAGTLAVGGRLRARASCAPLPDGVVDIRAVDGDAGGAAASTARSSWSRTSPRTRRRRRCELARRNLDYLQGDRVMARSQGRPHRSRRSRAAHAPAASGGRSALRDRGGDGRLAVASPPRWRGATASRASTASAEALIADDGARSQSSSSRPTTSTRRSSPPRSGPGSTSSSKSR